MLAILAFSCSDGQSEISSYSKLSDGIDGFLSFPLLFPPAGSWATGDVTAIGRP